MFSPPLPPAPATHVTTFSVYTLSSSDTVSAGARHTWRHSFSSSWGHSMLGRASVGSAGNTACHERERGAVQQQSTHKRSSDTRLESCSSNPPPAPHMSHFTDGRRYQVCDPAINDRRQQYHCSIADRRSSWKNTKHTNINTASKTFMPRTAVRGRQTHSQQ